MSGQDEGDVNWYKPEVGWQTQVSDYTRAYREIEEPALTNALWYLTPHEFRWPLSIAALTWIIVNSGDPVEVERCETALKQLRPNAELPGRKEDRASAQPAVKGRPAGKGKGKGKGGKFRGR